MISLTDQLSRQLEELKQQDLHRSLTVSDGVDFSSNDYLGLSRHRDLPQTVRDRMTGVSPFSSPASRLLRGSTDHHVDVEDRLAAFKGTEAALLFSSGYLANLALMTTLVRPEDRVLSDAQNHASLIDGIRLRRCHKEIYPHLNTSALEDLLERPHPGGRTFVVTESLYSMDGDIAPLDVYADLTERYDASLIVDDAHATGVFGDERASGLVEHFGVERRVAAVASTFGKALGLFGGFVAGPQVVVDYLVNRARQFIFTTAHGPFYLAAIESVLDLVAAEPGRRVRVLELADQLRARLRRNGIDCLNSSGPVVPVIIGENRRAMQVAERVSAAGMDVRAVRPPSVAPGTARLRISIHADHSEEEIDQLARLIEAELSAAPSHREEHREDAALR